MATYFDATKQEHLELLPKTLRSDEMLKEVAAQAEADVIGMFTEGAPYTNYTDREAQLQDGIVHTEVVGEEITAVGLPSGAVVPRLYVYLRGFKADASHANVDPNLKLALRRTIAEVIRWRLMQWKRELGIQASSDSIGKNRTYHEDVRSAFPPGWDRWLRPFKSDEPLASFG